MHSCIIDEEKHIICLKALFRRFCCNPLIVLATTLYTIFYNFNISLLDALGFATIVTYLCLRKTTIHRKDVHRNPTNSIFDTVFLLFVISTVI